jgi:hypothetical protein
LLFLVVAKRTPPSRRVSPLKRAHLLATSPSKMGRRRKNGTESNG